MLETANGKVLDVKKRPAMTLEQFVEANEEYKRIAEIRLSKINHQMNLLMQMRQMNGARYTERDVKSLISDIQYTLDVVEDYLLQTCMEKPGK